MYFVVPPLSAAAPSRMTWPVVVNEIAIHVLGVGLPAALIARRVGARSTAGSAVE